MNNTTNNKGFTLIESLVAMVVLSIGIFALYSMQVTAIRTNAKASTITTASNWASDQIETLLNRPYDCSPFEANCHDLDDVNGDGTNQDVDNDGVDDDGGIYGDFGLDNMTNTADNIITSPDGLYTIYLNVAVDTPVPLTKTIRIIVTSPSVTDTPPISMTYIKFRG